MDFDPTVFCLRSGWLGMLGGVLSGAVMGLFFLREDWLGGYGSQARRLIRLGHISFFGIGLLNLFYGLSLGPLAVADGPARWGAISLAVALVTMPLSCFLTAWRQPFRHLFPVPVLGATAGLLIMVTNSFPS